MPCVRSAMFQNVEAAYNLWNDEVGNEIRVRIFFGGVHCFEISTMTETFSMTAEPRGAPVPKGVGGGQQNRRHRAAGEQEISCHSIGAWLMGYCALNSYERIEIPDQTWSPTHEVRSSQASSRSSSVHP